MKRLLVPFLFFLLLSSGIQAQDSTTVSGRLMGFARKAALFNRSFAQEKVYLHFDNTGYFLGETIWFKAYVVKATDNGFTNMSKTLYVDLLTPEGYVLQSSKLRIEKGVCNGDFVLQDSLKAGFYEVRAYTRCMMNFGPEVVFSRVFPVFDEPKSDGDYTERNMTYRKFTIPDKRAKAPKRSKINVSFFPEGGSLVVGMESKVAFKATDNQGRSIAVSGKVVNAKGNEVAAFDTQHDGMGFFLLNPDGSEHTVLVSHEGKETKFKLPTPDTSGYLLSVFNLSTKGLRVMVQKSPNQTETDSLAMVVTCRGRILDFRIFVPSDEGTLYAYPKGSLPPGVCQFTLYDAAGRIRCERLAFVQPNLAGNLLVKTDKKEYKPYEKITLHLNATDSVGLQDGTSLSLAVRDGASSNFGNSDNGNIVTNLLLSSDLKGYIENPTWYFENTAFDRLLGLDLLMLTQGWRRYSWKRMEGLEPFKATHPIEEGILMDGKIRSLLAKKEVKGVDVMFWMIQDKQSFKGKCVTDENGNFNFLLDMYGKWELNLQTKLEEKRKEYRILLNRAFSPEARSYTGFDREVWTDEWLKISEPEVDSAALLLGEVKYATETKPSNPEGYKEYTLKEVVKTTRRPITMEQEAIRKASLGYDVGQVTDAHRDIGESEAPSILFMLQEENPYFTIAYNEDGSQGYRYKGRPVHFMFDKIPSEYTGARKVEELMADEIEKVLIVEDREVVQFFYPQDEKISTIIMLQFFKNGIKRKEPIGIRTTTFQGYSVSSEFYSPVHQPGIPILDGDYRRTLYWNPNLSLDATGKAKVEFFNNGSAKKLIIRAEGISNPGILLRND